VTTGEGAPTIGVDVGGTNTRVAVVDRDGRVLAEDRHHSPHGFPELVETIADGIQHLRGAHPEVPAVGVGTAGMVDSSGTVHYAPNLPQLIGAPMRDALLEKIDLPLVVDNDANVAAWGEACHGAARNVEHALVITLGTGVGGGIIANGRVYRGAHGFAAEVGHWQLDPNGPMCACGQRGHWEAVASGSGLGRLARERARAGQAPNVLARAGGQVDDITGVHVGDAAQAGEPDGVALLHEYAHFVALGLAGLVNILDPALVVISGGLIELGDVLLDPIRAGFHGHLEGAEHRPEVPIVAAALGERAGVIGAAALARDLVA
jgi:glucokinase